jgi:DNA-binding CsgD family transcriptional regulator
MALVRPSGGTALAMAVAPLSHQRPAAAAWIDGLGRDAARATAVVFVADPAAGGDRATAGERLRAIYGLTPAEAEVAVAVAGGEGLRAVAAGQGVALATVRTQAQQAYRKTGVRGQAGLARVVGQIAHLR